MIILLEHIVKNEEKLEDILALYKLTYDELVSYNLHITDFKNLFCGMKIKIPLISNEIEQILENTESFVKEYYPKVIDVVEEQVEELPPKINIQEETKYRGKPYPGIVPPKIIKK